MTRPFIIVVSGDSVLRHRLATECVPSPADIAYAADDESLTRLLGRSRPNVILIGVGATTQAPLNLVTMVRDLDPTISVILIAEQSSESLAIAAFRAGVADYFSVPFSSSEVRARVCRCMALPCEREGPDLHGGDRIVGRSLAVRSLKESICEVASCSSNVLVTGETGTGKELVADLIHSNSPRREKPLVAVNCAAVPDGLLESELFGYEHGAFTGASHRRKGLMELAHEGTLFLDEIGDMGLQGQAKVLRAIETKEVLPLGGKRPVRLDVRIVAATNQDPERALDEGRLRKDLYFRLNVARIHLPPLRERRSDIPLLLEHYLAKFGWNRRHQGPAFSKASADALEHYDWPGNIRELKNLIEGVLIHPRRGSIDLEDLPEFIRGRLGKACGRDDRERRRLLESLQTAQWNKSRAAGLLGWSRMTLYRKMAKYSLARSGDGPSHT